MMGSRTRKLLIGATILVLGLILLAFVCWPTHTEVPVTLAHYELIKLGMTEEEVVEVMGCPPGDYVGAFAYGTAGPEREGALPLGITIRFMGKGKLTSVDPATGRQAPGKYWVGKEGEIVVFFDQDGKVIERRYYYGFPESRFQYLRRRYGW